MSSPTKAVIIFSKRVSLQLAAVLWLGGCASYQYAQNVKLISFDEGAKKGQAVGNIRGEDCTWNVFGYQMGGLPTVDRAFINAKNQARGVEAAGLDSSGKSRGLGIRYVNNVTTENDGFNAFIVGKQCIVVKGSGYR
jgi:hypothetical protein